MIAKSTSPAATAVAASPVPLYGTVTAWTPVLMRNSAIDISVELPPAEPFNLPGYFLARLMNSARLFAGTLRLMAIT